MRQTLALEPRLKRELERSARETRKHARAEAQRRTDHRKAQVRAAVERAIWTEYESDEAIVLTHDLSERLSEEALSETFPDAPVDLQIQRICEDLGLSPPAHPRQGGDPSRAATGRPPDAPSAAWIPAFAGTSGEDEHSDPAPPDNPWA